MTTPRNLARRTDPRSSHEAAKRNVLSGANATQKQKVLAGLKKNIGMTSAELADAIGMDRYVVARRLPDLERDGLAERGSERDCEAKGGPAITWWPTGHKEEQLPLFESSQSSGREGTPPLSSPECAEKGGAEGSKSKRKA
jgi:hypothetical protein